MDEGQSLEKIKQELKELISELRDAVDTIKKQLGLLQKQIEYMGKTKEEESSENKKEHAKITEIEDEGMKVVEEFLSKKPLGPWSSTADIDM